MYVVVPPGGCHRETRRIELGPRVLSIGRAETSDVHLDVPGVDVEHARLSEIALIAIGADCAIGDVPLDAGSRRLVMPGDEIQIGSVVLALEGDDPSLAPTPPEGETPARFPKVRVVEGHNFGDELELVDENRPYVVGRAPKCELVLEDREVSREHLKLVRRGFAVFIQDQSSTRGSWLGRSSVYAGSTLEWSRPQMLRVGATVLALELPAEVRRAGRTAQASAGMTPPPRSRAHGAPSTPSSSPSATPAAARASQPPASRPAVAEAALAGPAMAMAALGERGGVALGNARGAQGSRRAWKKSGFTLGAASGALVLALAAVTVLGVLFVVFSLME